MFVKAAPHPEQPGASLKVRHPRTHVFLSEVGEEVPENRYWLRRLSQGDVVKADPPVAPVAHEGEPA